MAKKAILDVLESTIGKYVHNLDAQSLNVAVWSGKIQLSKLDLNTEAVNRKLSLQATEAPAFAIPLRVLGGHFDEFQVDVPWAKLTSKPVVLRAKGLTVIVEPYDHLAVEAIAPSTGSPNSTINATNTPGKSSSKLGASIKSKAAAVTAFKSRREQALEEANEARLKYNAIRRLTTDDDESDGSDGAGDLDTAANNNNNNFLTRLVRRIVENLQVEINNVRIEMRGCGCSSGVVLRSLSLVSTDENGEETFIDRGSNKTGTFFLHKELRIRDLGIYCDDNRDFKDNTNKDHSYILAPLSFRAKLRQADSLECVDFPKYLVTSEISNCSILIARSQLEMLHNVYTTILLRQHRNGAARPLFPDYRPLVPILDRKNSRSHAKEWWHYAVRCIGRLTRRTSWNEFFKAFQKRKEYIQLYKRQLHTQQGGSLWNKPLSREEKIRISAIEKDRSISVEGIMLWRSMADAQYEMENRKHKRQQELKRLSSGVRGSSRQTPIKTTHTRDGRNPFSGGGGIRESATYKRNASLIVNLFGNKDSRKESGEALVSDENVSSDGFSESAASSSHDAPIQLTPEELRELEALHMEQTSELLMSKDSKLYDFQFRLGSFKMDFISHGLQPLAKLQMGTVSTALEAKADGSFSVVYSMSHLQIDDKVTYNTLFPSVVRTLQVPEQETSEVESRGAFLLKLEHEKNGDAKLTVRGAAVELVASPNLFAGIKDFITITPGGSYENDLGALNENGNTSSALQSVYNPMMTQSVSGSVDLFFDAKSGTNSQLFGRSKNLPSPEVVPSESFLFWDETTTVAAREAAQRVSDKVSKALADAWTVKNNSQRRWLVDLDIHAPIFVLPENCTDSDASVLVLNFGRLIMKPQNSTPHRMLDWCRSHSGGDEDQVIESWRLKTNELSLRVGTAGRQDWDRSTDGELLSLPIIEPMSLTLDFGIEAQKAEDSRSMMDGTIPVISFQISPKRIQRILAVSMAWTKFWQQLRVDGGVEHTRGSLNVIDEESDSAYDNDEPFRRSLLSRQTASTRSFGVRGYEGEEGGDKQSTIFFSQFALGRFSVSFSVGDDPGIASNGVEAHLASVVFEHTRATNGASRNRANMGWFWILDRLPATYPRKQRLIAHSKLPFSPDSFAAGGKYEIIEALEEMGVFDSSYHGSSNLADIIISVPSEIEQPGDTAGQIVIHAVFSSLIVNWNPYAVKAIRMMQDNLLAAATEYAKGSSSPIEATSYPGSKTSSSTPQSVVEGSGSMNVQQGLRREVAFTAQMDDFSINFHSAKDDLLLFSVTMCRASVDVLIYEDGESLTASLELGDFRTDSSRNTRTLQQYTTILGLAPGQNSSLLQVQYYKGCAPIVASGMEGVDPSKHEACAELALSPMRFVHIQAKVLTILEYVQEGVLAQLAPVDAQGRGVDDTPVQGMGAKVFDIQAKGFEVIVPRAAYSSEYFKATAGLLDARYFAAANQGGGEAKLTLSQMSLACHSGVSMVPEPVEMTVEASIGPTHAKKIEDRVVRANIIFKKAAFAITRSQLEQLLFVMKLNIQEDEPFFRDKLSRERNTKKPSKPAFDTGTLTHAGTQLLIIKKRIFADVTAGVVSIAYRKSADEAPIMKLSALSSELNVALVPDMKKLAAELTFQNVYVRDCRRETEKNTFRNFFSQFHVNEQTTDSSHLDVFNLNFDRNEESGSTDIEIKVGTPQVVILPNLLLEVAEIAKIPELVERSCMSANTETSLKKSTIEVSNKSAKNLPASSPTSVTTRISIKTSTCRIVALDVAQKVQITKRGTVEDIGQDLLVMQGKIDASLRSAKDVSTGKQLAQETQVNGDAFEAYIARGEKFNDPLQIVEPARFSLFFNKSSPLEEETENLILKLVALTPLDVSFSLQNAALLRMILRSVQESIESVQQNAESMEMSVLHAKSKDHLMPLTENEASRIEHLSFALEHESLAEKSSFVRASAKQQALHLSEMNSSEKLQRGSSSNSEFLSKFVDVHVTMPDAAITIVNDFGGLDNPLFKVRTRNVVGKGQADWPAGPVPHGDFSINRACFRLRINSSVLANYYDAASNMWEPLLLKPWETTVTFQRSDKHRFQRKIERMSTDLDVESQRCLVSFSEQFLVSIGAASKMWSLYTGNDVKEDTGQKSTLGFAQSATTPAVPAPYGIDNQTGLKVEYIIQPKLTRNGSAKLVCPTGQTRRFNFNYPRGAGVGGKRAYGQDSKECKELIVFVGKKCIQIANFDAELNNEDHAYDCGGGILIFTSVVKIKRVMLLRLRSRIHIYNQTSVPFGVAVQNKEGISDVGVCKGGNMKMMHRQTNESAIGQSNSLAPDIPSLGVPVTSLKNFIASSNTAHADAGLTILLSPGLSGVETFKPNAKASFYDGNRSEKWGAVALPPPYALVQMAEGEEPISSMDVLCAQVGNNQDNEEDDTIVTTVCVRVSLIDDTHPCVEIIIMPRAVFQNTLPVALLARTPLPHTYSASSSEGVPYDAPDSKRHTIHKLQQHDVLEVFSTGPSIAITLKCADDPVAGAATGWLDGVWVDIPLGHGRLPRPVHCAFPFIGQGRRSGGMDVFICEEAQLLSWQSNELGSSSDLSARSIDTTESETVRKVVFAAANYAIDHTSSLLFEVFRSSPSQSRHSRASSVPTESSHFWSAFIGNRGQKRVTLLPNENTSVRVLHFGTEGHGSVSRSAPFLIKDIAICEGGIQSSAILWEDNSPSGFFAYRRMIGVHQSEVNIVPEFIIINSGEANVIVKQSRDIHFSLAPRKMTSISTMKDRGVFISVAVPDICGETKPMKVDTLGTRIRVVRSSVDGQPMGSLAVQTVVGTCDSRLAIKIGAVKFGGLKKLRSNNSVGLSLFSNDFVRLRVRWSQLEITLNDTGVNTSSKENSQPDRYVQNRNDLALSKDKQISSLPRYKPVAQIQFLRFTVDFQCIYKDVDYTDPEPVITDAERSQFSLIVHNMVVIDRDGSSQGSVVFESASPVNFIDLCIRCRGPLDADLVKVDLLDLNLAYAKGQTETIRICTDESFVWRLLDVTNRILVAISNLTGTDTDPRIGVGRRNSDGSEMIEHDLTIRSDDAAYYSAPKSDKLFDIKTAQISPIKLVVSFKRQPQTSRYNEITTMKMARLVNYFVRQLKFSVENAELRFSGYKINEVKGPAGRAIELAKEVYVTRIKLQLFSLVGSVSIQEWKALSARSEGKDDYIEGDVLRMTGHIVGRSAGYVFKKFGEGLGEGFSSMTGTIGEGVESATDMIGLGFVGSGVNNVVSGIGDGVASTVKGVGSGASKVVKGAGVGAGQVLGGVGGGFQMAAKGISKGVTRGDGSAVISGLSDGAASAMLGVGQGLETAFYGATDGVTHLGQGLFHGVTSVGRGLGDALTGQRKKNQRRERASRRSDG